MKKTFTKKTLVAGIAAALMTLTATNVNAKETFPAKPDCFHPE